MHLHDVQTYLSGGPDGHAFDLSHTIHLLKFGPLDTEHVPEDALTLTTPLSETAKQSSESKKKGYY